MGVFLSLGLSLKEWVRGKARGKLPRKRVRAD